MPNLCIDTSVVPTGRTPRGALVIPPSTQQVGQWNAGAPTTETSTGTTLIAGHVTLGAQGKGALFLLSTVHAGDRVYLTGTTGTVTRWTIVALSEVQKTRLPDSVFAGRQGPRQLVVVTCGGPIIDLPGYGPWHRDNVIATATPS